MIFKSRKRHQTILQMIMYNDRRNKFDFASATDIVTPSVICGLGIAWSTFLLKLRSVVVMRSLTFILLPIMCLSLSGCSRSDDSFISKKDILLDTVVSISIYDESMTDELEAAMKLCQKYDELFSPSNENSDVYKMNHRAENVYTPEPEVLDVIETALEYARISDGAYDITIAPVVSLWDFKSEAPRVPSDSELAEAVSKVDYRNVHIEGETLVFANDDVQIDLGGIAKGYIADKIAEYLVESGVESALINLGGNVLCVGTKPSGKNFNIAIEDPLVDGSVIGTVEIDGLSVVSSGTYERYFENDGKRYHHILDPKTGYPYENGLAQTSIIGPSSCICDALSTTCFALGGEKGMELIDSMEGYYAIFVDEDGNISYSENAVGKLILQ